MKYKGRITKLNMISRSGIIKAFSNDFNHGIPFKFDSIVNFKPTRITEGLIVKFSITKNTKNRGYATEIVISYPKPTMINDAEAFEQWEIIEKEWEAIETKYNPLINSSENTSEELESSIKPQKTDGSKYVALALFERKIKIVSLSKDGEYSFLDEGKKYHNILYPSFIEEAALDLAIEEFEDLLNNPKSEEKHFQEFLEHNPNFILNDEYKKAHPHIVLAKDNNRKLIPDFVLEPVNQSEFCDLLELKLPTAQIYVMKKNREHFSSAITEAVAQLRTYANFFNEEKNRNNFQKKYPYLKIYKPRMFLIIGRQTNENSFIKREIQDANPQLILKNFDELLARMKWKQEKLKNKNKLFR